MKIKFDKHTKTFSVVSRSSSQKSFSRVDPKKYEKFFDLIKRSKSYRIKTTRMDKWYNPYEVSVNRVILPFDEVNSIFKTDSTSDVFHWASDYIRSNNLYPDEQLSFDLATGSDNKLYILVDFIDKNLFNKKEVRNISSKSFSYASSKPEIVKVHRGTEQKESLEGRDFSDKGWCVIGSHYDRNGRWLKKPKITAVKGDLSDVLEGEGEWIIGKNLTREEAQKLRDEYREKFNAKKSFSSAEVKTKDGLTPKQVVSANKSQCDELVKRFYRDYKSNNDGLVLKELDECYDECKKDFVRIDSNDKNRKDLLLELASRMVAIEMVDKNATRSHSRTFSEVKSFSVTEVDKVVVIYTPNRENYYSFSSPVKEGSNTEDTVKEIMQYLNRNCINRPPRYSIKSHKFFRKGTDENIISRWIDDEITRFEMYPE